MEGCSCGLQRWLVPEVDEVTMEVGCNANSVEVPAEGSQRRFAEEHGRGWRHCVAAEACTGM